MILKHLYCSIVAMAVAVPTVSFAQDASGEALASDGAFVPGDIVVTARKRTESLLAVPVAVTAFDSRMLEQYQVSGLQDIGPAVPSLVVSTNQGSQNGATIFIRGIGQDNSHALNEPGVGVYLDGVYLGRSIGSLMDMNNFERIEVLRGPQGTLYGRNTPGGAVKLVSKRPEFDAMRFTGDFTLGSFNRLDVRGSVNVPVADNFAFTVSGVNLTNDGYYKNVLTGKNLNRKDTTALRATALWEPTDNLSFFLTADYAKDRSGMQVGTPYNIVSPNNFSTLYGGRYLANPDLVDNNKYDGGGVSLTTELDLGSGSLSSITAFRKMNYDMSYDFGASPIGNDLFTELMAEQFSQELQYVSDLDGILNFTAGLFYFHEYTDNTSHFLVATATGTPLQTTPTPKLDLPYISQQSTDSYSAYGEVYITPMEPLTITLGGRFTHDKKEITRGGAGGTGTGGKSFNNFSPKVNIDYKFDTNTHVYATWSNGYKAGVYQPYPSALTQFAVIPPEKVQAWEAGFKGEFFDRLVQLSLAAYINNYDDLQINISSDAGQVVANSADLRTKGIEAELLLRPAPGFTVASSLTLAKSKFTRVPVTSGAPLITDKAKNLPSYQIRVAPNYVASLGEDSEVELGVVFTATGKDYKILPNAPFHLQKAYETLDARIVFRRPEQGWSIALAGKNLTDQETFTTSTFLAGQSSSIRFYQPGRTWSATLGVDF